MRRFSTIVAIALAMFSFASICSAQRVPNPSFEQPQLVSPFACGLQPRFPPCSNIPGWSWTSSEPIGSLYAGDALLWAIGYSDRTGGITTAGQGKQFVTLGGGFFCGNPGLPPCVGTWSWTTTVTGLIAGDTYFLTFKIANECFAMSQSITATVTGGANDSGTFTTKTGYGDCYWMSWEQERLGPFTATGSTTTATFTVTNQQYDIGLDDVAITPPPATGGTWTRLTNQRQMGQPCYNAGATFLLTDGTVLVHEEPNPPTLPTDNFANWCILTPDAYGSYINATWKQVDSSPYAPLYFAAAVLPDKDARVIIEGGEYVQPGPGQLLGNPVWTNKGAIFDPTQPTGKGLQWATVKPPPGWGYIGDAQSVVLPDGTFMLASCCSTEESEMPPPYTGWVSTGLMKHDENDEEGWTLLPGPPDAEVVLTVETYVSGLGCGGANTGAEIYINGIWICTADTPTQLWDSTYHEMGPAVLRPDGTVFQAGGTIIPSGGRSAIFDNSDYQWTQGPNFPNDKYGNPLDIADGPAALLPNGNVLMMASSPGNPSKEGATFFELQYLTNNLVPALTFPPNAPNDESFYGHMLVLPTGQVLFTDFSSDVEIYTPTDPNYSNSWAPVLQDITAYGKTTPVANCFGHITTFPPPPCITISQGSTNMLDGYQLNGLSQGAAYGDDYQSATNYPLVRIVEEIVPFCIVGQSCPVPLVYYCRTHDHSNMGVATGNLLVSTSFDCPNVPIGFKGYLEVVANGIGGGGIPVIVGK